MKYCTNCGTALEDTAAFCTNCGTAVASDTSAAAPAEKKEGQFNTIIKLFLVLGTVLKGWSLIPLLWCLPITIHVFRKLDKCEEVSMGIKICSIFVSPVACILLLLNDTKF